MNDFIYRQEERVIDQLRALKAQASDMAELFKDEHLSIDYENWSAVSGLLDQALHRFGAAA